MVETSSQSAISKYNIENFMHLKSDAHPSHLILRIWSGLNIVESQKEMNGAERTEFESASRNLSATHTCRFVQGRHGERGRGWYPHV